MKSRKKMLPYLLIATLSLIGFLLYINTFDPKESIELVSVGINPIVPFFIIIFLIVSCTFAFILAHSRRGLIVGLAAVALLLLQYFNYNNMLYTAIVIIIFLLIEFLFWKKK